MLISSSFIKNYWLSVSQNSRRVHKSRNSFF